MPLNLTDFNQSFNITPIMHVQTIQKVIKDTSPSQEYQEIINSSTNAKNVIYLCRGSWCIQILNIALSGHAETIQNVIKDINPSQENL